MVIFRVYVNLPEGMSCKRVPSNKTDGMDVNESKWDGYGMEMEMEMELMGMECFNLSMCLGNSDALFFSPVPIGKIVKPLDAANSSEHRKLMETQWKAMEMDGKCMGNRWKLLKFPKLMRICFGSRDIRIYQASPRAI